MVEKKGMAAGQAEMDAEHRVQVGLIQALDRAVERGTDKDGIAALVRQLMDYTNVHFMSEQLLMRLGSYPDLAEHEDEHDRMMEQLRRVEAGFTLGNPKMMVAESQLLRHLLVEHIRTHDLSLGHYLSQLA